MNKSRLTAAALAALTIPLLAQPPAPAPGGAAPPRRQGGFIPGQQRVTGDPAQIERGNKIYGVACRSCHGADLRGGDMGGPNLLRSMAALSDRDGEAIVPIIQGSLQGSGMPAIPMPPADAKAVAAYVRSVLATIGSQGKPPGALAPENVVTGDAKAGQVYFDSKCVACHSATGDLKGFAGKITDPRALQAAWVMGGGGRGRGPVAPSARRTMTATVTSAAGERFEGKVVRIDDFLVTLELAGGGTRSFSREGDLKVAVNDPMKAHKDLLTTLNDKDMHDVTAFLVTLK